MQYAGYTTVGNAEKWLIPVGKNSVTSATAGSFAEESALPAPTRGLLRNLTIATDVAVATSGLPATVSVNGADTALTATVGVAGTAAEDNSHTVQVQQGDAISFHENTNTATGAGLLFFSFELIPN